MAAIIYETAFSPFANHREPRKALLGPVRMRRPPPACQALLELPSDRKNKLSHCISAADGMVDYADCRAGGITVNLEEHTRMETISAEPEIRAGDIAISIC